jgi:hypothetical protein
MTSIKLFGSGRMVFFSALDHASAEEQSYSLYTFA